MKEDFKCRVGRGVLPVGSMNDLALVPSWNTPFPKVCCGPDGLVVCLWKCINDTVGLQILSGIGLSMVYVPTARDAYDSLLFLNYEQPMGWFMRALHFWSGSAMVVMVLVHMTQVFLHGSIKVSTGAHLGLRRIPFLLTLGLAFSGQVLRWDTDAYWGVGVGASMLGRVPWVGPILVQLLLGGEIIGSSTLARFSAAHVLSCPDSFFSPWPFIFGWC